jgi:hypothetical protein
MTKTPQIDYFFVRNYETDQEIKLGSDFEFAQIRLLVLNSDGDHSDNQPWELFAKLK